VHLDLRHRTARQRFSNDAASRCPFAGMSNLRMCAHCPPMSELLTGASVDESRFEIRTYGGHEIHRVGAAEASVHALPLSQAGVGHLRRAQHRHVATRSKRAEVDDDGGARRDGAAREIELRSAEAFPKLLPSRSSTNRPLT